MATLTTTRAASTFPVFQASGAGIVSAAYGTYDVSVDPTPNDIYEICKVPAGAVILSGHLYAADLDTNATETLDLDVGWSSNGGSGTYDAANPAGLGNFGVITGDAFAAGNVSNVTGVNYPLNGLLATGVLPTFTKETTIIVTAIDDAATLTAGALTVIVYYVVP